jgi:zinc protease
MSFSYPDTTAKHWQLPNGLDIIIKEDHSAEVASLQAWCAVGSIHEDEWLGAGLSHILEHMLFKGTSKRKGPQISTQVQDVGGYINAYTSFDRTVYWIDTPSAGVPTCLDVLMDVMTNATLPEDEYDKEQEVIRREFAMGFDDPDRMSSQQLFGTAFQTHPYKHPVIGHLDIFNQLTRDDVLTYYKRHYVPNNMLFVITGDVDSNVIHATLEKHFADIPRAAYTPVTIPQEPAQLGRRESHIEFETQLSKMHLAWHIPSISHPDMPALDVLATIFGQGRSSRLYKTIREEKCLAHSIGSHSYTPAHGGIFSVSATVDPDKRVAVESEVHAMLADLIREGVTEAELAKAKKSFLVDMLSDLTTMRGQANDIAMNWMLTHNLNFTRDYLMAIDQVEAAEVQSVASSYLATSNLTSVSLNPKDSLPKNSVDVLVKNATSTELAELPNGLKLLTRADKRLPLVSIRGSFLGGLLAEDDTSSGLTSLLTRTWVKGSKQRSAAEIADLTESVGASIGASGGNNTFSLSVGCLSSDVPLGLDVLQDVLKHPSFPDSEIEKEKAVQIAGIKAEDDHLVSVAVRELRKHLFGSHPYHRARSGTEASVAALTQNQLGQLHAKHVCAKNGIIAAYGDINPGTIRDQLETAFGDLSKGSHAFADLDNPSPVADSQVLELNTDKQQAVLVTGYQGISVYDDDRLALELVEEACSDMSSRLFMRIREEMGLAYYVSAAQMFGLAGGAFYFYLGTDPEQLDEVQAALEDEVDKLIAGGLEDKELVRAKKTYLGKHAMDKQSPGAVAMLESLDELYGFGHPFGGELEARVNAITHDDIKRVLARFFAAQESITVRVSPQLG